MIAAAGITYNVAPQIYRVVLVDAETSQPDLTDEVFGLAFTPDGKTLLAEQGDSMWWWDLKTGKTTLKAPMQVAARQFAVARTAFSPDGKKLVGGLNLVIDLATAKEIARVQSVDDSRHDRDNALQAVAFSSDGKNGITTLRDGTTTIWDLAQDKLVRRFSPGLKYDGESAGLSGDGSLVVVSPQEYFTAPHLGPHSCQIWDTGTGKELLTFKFVNVNPLRSTSSAGTRSCWSPARTTDTSALSMSRPARSCKPLPTSWAN